MKLLCFQAKHFGWKTHSQSLSEALDQGVNDEVENALVIFIHAEQRDEDAVKTTSVARQTLKHVKWLANKREIENIVIHSFTHLGGESATPAFAESFIKALAGRLRQTGYHVWLTPFGYFCEWTLSVYGESLAKVWKEI